MTTKMSEIAIGKLRIKNTNYKVFTEEFKIN
jgi:hypothetical protein